MENPKPIEDLRLDGDQMSFSEYDDDLTSKGEITAIDLYMRFTGDPDNMKKYTSAIDNINEKIKLAKEAAKNQNKTF